MYLGLMERELTADEIIDREIERYRQQQSSKKKVRKHAKKTKTQTTSKSKPSENTSVEVPSLPSTNQPTHTPEPETAPPFTKEGLLGIQLQEFVCSECKADVPATANQCQRCGVKFE